MVNPVTKISYSVGAHHDVPLQITLKVFDTSGREIETLVNKKQPAGNYNVTFNAKDLASGIYIYTLETNSEFKQSRKMLLIK